mgnify:CR=1 FL=1
MYTQVCGEHNFVSNPVFCLYAGETYEDEAKVNKKPRPGGFVYIQSRG